MSACMQTTRAASQRVHNKFCYYSLSIIYVAHIWALLSHTCCSYIDSILITDEGRCQYEINSKHDTEVVKLHVWHPAAISHVNDKRNIKQAAVRLFSSCFDGSQCQETMQKMGRRGYSPLGRRAGCQNKKRYIPIRLPLECRALGVRQYMTTRRPSAGPRW